MTLIRRLLPLLCALAPSIAGAQRPSLSRDKDPNDWEAYYDFGVEQRYGIIRAIPEVSRAGDYDRHYPIDHITVRATGASCCSSRTPSSPRRGAVCS